MGELDTGVAEGGGLGDTVAGAIYLIRGQRVILDLDVAEFFGTTTGKVNQYRKRNADRFSELYAFELSAEEWEALRSQDVISAKLRSRRYRPWAYTEHGFTMLSMGMKGARAATIAHVVIDTFVSFRRGTLSQAPVLGGANARRDRRTMIEAIQTQMRALLEVRLPSGDTVSEELDTITRKAITRVKAVIDAPVVNQEKLLSEIALIEAETRRTYSEIRKMEAETQKLWNEVYIGRLDLIVRMREMVTQLERDEVRQLAEGTFDALPQGEAPANARLLPGDEDHKT
ncbi:ORF6N domain-containing protein [Salipiger sp. H15]|uniref:ORF6N domain-containing protein n=1 Tax=Alloyangia sp. H15 TaxID=3029062 RepID=A0AAU8AHK2_9RHOB